MARAGADAGVLPGPGGSVVGVFGRGGAPWPVAMTREFVVDLLEDTGMMDRAKAELMLSIFEWVEVEAQGFPGSLEAL